jgi:hypothetical protein
VFSAGDNAKLRKKTSSALYWRTEMEPVSKILQSVQITDNKVTQK